MFIILGIVFLIVIFIVAYILLKIRDDNNRSWAKKNAKKMLDRGELSTPSAYWRVCNKLAKVQKNDLEAGELLEQLKDLKKKGGKAAS